MRGVLQHICFIPHLADDTTISPLNRSVMRILCDDCVTIQHWRVATGLTKRYHTITQELCILYPHKISEDDSIEPCSLTRAEIEANKECASSEGDRRRWHVILLLKDKKPVAEIVAATGYRPRTIRQIAQRYRDRGPSGLEDGRTHSKGASPILSDEEQHELRQTLKTSPPGGGVWTGPKVAQWIAAKTGKHIHRQRGWEYLCRLRLDDD